MVKGVEEEMESDRDDRGIVVDGQIAAGQGHEEDIEFLESREGILLGAI